MHCLCESGLPQIYFAKFATDEIIICSRMWDKGIKTEIFRVRTESWILKKVLKFAQQFSRPGKAQKIDIKSWKEVKSLDFLKATSALWVKFCFRFGHILINLVHTFAAHHKEALFLRLLRSLLITYLITDLESGKRNYCFGKSLEEVFNFGSKNLYKP